LAWSLACQPLWPCPGRHPRARTPLPRSPTITRSPAPLPVEPRPDFLPRIWSIPALCYHLGQHSMSLRCLGSRSWRNGRGLWIDNGIGLVMWEIRTRFCLFNYVSWFSRVLSRSFALVCLSLACLACLWFCRRPTGIGRAGFLCFSSVETLWPTPLYKASMYIVRAFFFTQQFTLSFTL
jgi:hypothetical protein